MILDREQVTAIIQEEVTRLLQEDSAFRYMLTGMMVETFAQKTDLRQVLDAIHALREDANARFAAHEQRMEEHSVAIRQLTERMEEHSRLLDKHIHRTDRGFLRLENIIGGLGARWGIMSEEAFRQGVRGILTDVGLKVERFWQMDPEGTVFGHPDQVEIDVVVSDGQVILVEIKSSMSRADVYLFQRKVEFYERVKDVRVSRKLVVSPFVEPKALERAQDTGMEVYTSGYDVPPNKP